MVEKNKFKKLSPDEQASIMEIVDEIRYRIEDDKNHLRSLGYTVPRLKGHVRSMMLIDELKEELGMS